MSVKKNIYYTVFSQVISFFLLFAFNLFSSRFLGPEQYGLYTMLLLVPYLFGRFGHLGLDAANAFFSHNDKSERIIFSNSIIVITFSSGLFTLVIFVDSFVYKYLSFGYEFKTFLSMLAIVAFSMFRTLFQSLLIGKDKIKINSIISIFDSLYPLIGLMLLYFFNALSAFNLMLVTLVGLLLTSCLIMWNVSFGRCSDFNVSFLKRSIRYGFDSWVNNISNQMLYKIDFFLIGYFLGLESVGIYAIAVMLAEKSWYLSGALGNAIFPKLKCYDDTKAFQLATSVAKLNLVIVTISLVLIAVLGDFLIPILFGESYSLAYETILILTPGIIALAIPKVLVSHLAARNKLRIAVRASVSSVLLNLILNLLLIPQFGLIGAAVASSISYVIYLAIYVIEYRKEFSCKYRSILIPNVNDLVIIKNAR